MRLRLSIVTVALAAAAAAAGFAAPGGRAAVSECVPPPAVVQPFLPWQDTIDYVLAPGGSFEPGTPSWTLGGGAAVVTGDSAPNALDPATDDGALYLPAGSTALSPCVTSPRIAGVVRLFAKSLGDPAAQLDVQVLVRGVAYDAGTFSAGGTWAPSPVLVSDVPWNSGATAFQVRLTPVGAGAAFAVDDVYVDPYSGR